MYHGPIECTKSNNVRNNKIRVHKYEEKLGISSITAKSKEIEWESKRNDCNDKEEIENNNKKWSTFNWRRSYAWRSYKKIEIWIYSIFFNESCRYLNLDCCYSV